MTAVRQVTFTGFDPYKLTGVTVTDRKLGHGSYATVLELEYMGLKCAGKKIHELLLEQGDASYTVCRFEEECRLLSQIRHPNVVQFLGVYFQHRVRAPILVMEFLPTNLTSCIEQYGILPKEISYSILHDVALGLCYLHSQIPPIIHRDLSSNNVLLTPNMTAKISDLGMARILNLTPLQVSRMTQTPGTPAYMPPEVMVANPKYDRSVDEFSYGILMIHMFSSKWPEPQVGPICTEPDGTMIPVSEAGRREVFLQAIGNDHPLMELILKCIHNHPQTRAHANKIVEQLAEMVLQFPASFANRLELLRQIEADRKEKGILTEVGEKKDRIVQEKEDEILICREVIQALTEEGEKNNRIIQQKDNQILLLQEEFLAEKKQQISEIDQLIIAHSSEVEQLRLQIGDLSTQNKLATAKMEAEVAELKSNIAIYMSQIESSSMALIQDREKSEQIITKEREQSESQLAKEREQSELQLTKEREQSELRLAQERERSKKLVTDIQNLQSNWSKLRSENTILQHSISELQTNIAKKDCVIQMNNTSAKRKETELEAKSRALEEKDATISAMSEQLTKAREYLTNNQQVLQVSMTITWKECAELPIYLCRGKTTVINHKIYCGGGTADDEDEEHLVYCYEPTQDKWTTLPPLPVRYFGLGQVDGMLVAVGGWKRSNETTDMVLSYDERSQQWGEKIPPMPIARYSPGILSLQSALLVAGGYAPSSSQSSYTAAVEIFRPDTSQWYLTNPLPTACQDIHIMHNINVTIGSTCYALGGHSGSYLNQALYASVDDLLYNAVPANQTTHNGISDTNSAWKTLPNTPTYRPAAAMLADHLFAIGGDEFSEGGADKKEVYMYSPSTNSWIYINDLPAPRSIAVVAILSSTEILVIGGWDGGDDGDRVDTVYKGTLVLKL